ncbi:NHL repeat-containing protein [Mucilaginibacter agri]|uniref:NHL repeat-containing protein n=1 Tax=Mucilaginibacter agri TaxID=2695265 RepID=A0A965ZL80_9SPHI|nr:hypothetical protein [Mucilaginibacter agri]NCD71646.1 hypothetical protein [Mucilaginibacter agri]
MKTKILLFALLALSVAGCKKDVVTAAKPADEVEATSGMQLATNAANLPLTIKTIAGKTGEKFDYPNGIDVADDGNIYVAEQNASKIYRITPGGVVTTLAIPNAPDGDVLSNPMRVRVQKNGTINILTQNSPFVVARNNMWIIKPGGQVLTPPFAPGGPSYDPNGRSFIYYDLETDGVNGNVYISGIDARTGTSALQKFEVSPQGYLGTGGITIPQDSVYKDPMFSNDPTIMEFYLGYNGVKYIVLNYRSIYKLTPSGVFTRIFRDLKFDYIHSIVGTKNGRTLYIIDDAALKRIVDGKLQYISGPSKPFDAGDGVGVYADVRPTQLALSKDESILYFTDRNLVREVLLK